MSRHFETCVWMKMVNILYKMVFCGCGWFCNASTWFMFWRIMVTLIWLWSAVTDVAVRLYLLSAHSGRVCKSMTKWRASTQWGHCCWPHCGGKTGEHWCLLPQRSVGTKQPVCTGWGQGAQDEVNVLQPNNQHVDFFTGWPSSARGRSLVPLWGCGHGHTAPARIMIDGLRFTHSINNMDSLQVVSKCATHLIQKLRASVVDVSSGCLRSSPSLTETRCWISSCFTPSA